MTIAVTYENGDVFQHFGHTEQFKLYETDGKSIISSKVIGTGGQGHGALSMLLASYGVETLICGGIGPGAQIALSDACIDLYAGIQGSADEAVKMLLLGELEKNSSANCDHHNHGEHSCDDHDHNCGHGCH